MPRRPALRLLVLLVALGTAAPVGAAPPTDPDPQAPTRGAVAGLKSPFQRERQEAARLLTALLPASRAAVLEAWTTGDEALRATLAEVLAAEGSAELMLLLIEAWCDGGDRLAASTRSALVLVPEATRRGIAAYRAKHPEPGRRTRRPVGVLEPLLTRDEVERLFISRKSKSGGTGVYRGQYEVLRPHREMALEVCLHILTDQALRLPGTSAVGGYRFLRPVGQVLDAWEVREMALSAIADLATADDEATLAGLEAYLESLREVPDSPPWGWAGRPDPEWRPEKDYLFDDLLVTLYRLAPKVYARELTDRMAFRDGRARQGSTSEAHAAISLRLRANMYADAARLYRELLRRSESRSGDYYNLACTYALWSLEPGGLDPAKLRSLALDALRSAVDEQWTDIGWLQQDRDLDPVRDTPEFKAQIERIKAIIASDKPVARPPEPRFPRGR